MLSKIPRPLLILFLVVMANYVAQIPYAWHLYGLHVNPAGAALLGLTFIWFMVGFWFLVQRTAIGYWLIVAFLAVQFLFYFENEIILMFRGYGLIYHLTNMRDPVVWAVEVVGEINFFVATFCLYYLLRNRRALLDEGSNSSSQASTRGA